VSNAWQRTDGGCICADAPNAVTSAAAIVRQASIRQSITRPRATRSSIASSPARTGSTITEREKLFRVPSCAALVRIRRINLCRDPRAGYPQNGKASCTSKLAVRRSGSTFGLDRTERWIVDAVLASVRAGGQTGCAHSHANPRFTGVPPLDRGQLGSVAQGEPATIIATRRDAKEVASTYGL
jgi:hypothetical protein